MTFVKGMNIYELLLMVLFLLNNMFVSLLIFSLFSKYEFLSKVCIFTIVFFTIVSVVLSIYGWLHKETKVTFY